MDCKIIEDLLPLYHDAALSQESCALVESHLDNCAACARFLEDIRENIKQSSAPIAQQPLANGIKSLKKRWKRKTIQNIILSAVCVLVFASALFFGVFFWERPLSYQEAKGAVTQPVHSALDFITNASGCSSVYAIKQGDSLYIYYTNTVWTRYFASSNRRAQLTQFRSLVFEALPSPPAMPTVPSLSENLHDGAFPMAPEMPEAPEIPDIYSAIGEITTVYYLAGDFNLFARDADAFHAALGAAVLLWEK